MFLTTTVRNTVKRKRKTVNIKMILANNVLNLADKTFLIACLQIPFFCNKTKMEQMRFLGMSERTVFRVIRKLDELNFFLREGREIYSIDWETLFNFLSHDETIA
mgnify:CR=1 FL=1